MRQLLIGFVTFLFAIGVLVRIFVGQAEAERAVDAGTDIGFGVGGSLIHAFYDGITGQLDGGDTTDTSTEQPAPAGA